MSRLALLGCGSMGKDILRGMLRQTNATSTFPMTQYVATVTRSSSAQQLKTEFEANVDKVKIICGNNVQAAEEADVILLGFPPSQVHNVLTESNMSNAISDKLVISILAGVPKATIQGYLRRAHVIRILPSLGAKAYESASLFVEDEPPIPQHLQELTQNIFGAVGQMHRTPPHLFDDMTGLNGVCHAAMSIIIETICDACVGEGIPRDLALIYAASCFRGYATLLSQGVEPAELKKSLAIPKGLTTHAMLSLEKGGLRPNLIDAISETVKYTKSMGKD